MLYRCRFIFISKWLSIFILSISWSNITQFLAPNNYQEKLHALLCIYNYILTHPLIEKCIFPLFLVLTPYLSGVFNHATPPNVDIPLFFDLLTLFFLLYKVWNLWLSPVYSTLLIFTFNKAALLTLYYFYSLLSFMPLATQHFILLHFLTSRWCIFRILRHSRHSCSWYPQATSRFR